MLAVPADHPLAHRASVSRDEIARERVFFADALPGYWIDHHLPVPDRLTASLPGFQEILVYVTSGHGVAIVGAQTSNFYPRPGLICIPMGGNATFDYALVWRTDRLRSIAEAFLRHITPLTGS